MPGRAARALEIVKSAGVHLLMSGHHHRAVSGSNAEVGADSAILVLHAGTAISTRTRGSEGNTYNLLDIAGQDVSVRLMEYAHDRFREKHIDRFSFDGKQWSRTERAG